MLVSKISDEKWFLEAAAAAQQSLCLRDKCGSVIIKDESIIARGYNAPPLDDLGQRTCLNDYDLTKKPKFDKSCCMHAEWRAIFNALRHYPGEVQGSTLYFMRLDEKGSMTRAGQPYCTVCSRLALDAGIKLFCLWREDGIVAYPTDLYNQLSYQFFSKE